MFLGRNAEQGQRACFWEDDEAELRPRCSPRDLEQQESGGPGSSPPRGQAHAEVVTALGAVSGHRDKWHQELFVPPCLSQLPSALVWVLSAWLSLRDWSPL